MMKEGNEQYLQDKPTMDYLDMVKVYFINIEDGVEGNLILVFGQSCVA